MPTFVKAATEEPSMFRSDSLYSPSPHSQLVEVRLPNPSHENGAQFPTSTRAGRCPVVVLDRKAPSQQAQKKKHVNKAILTYHLLC